MNAIVSTSLAHTDVHSAAALHARAFDRHFLSSVGERFLREFYRGFVTDPDAVTRVTRDDAGRIVGVVVGTVAPDRSFRRLLRTRGLQLALAGVGAVVRRPSKAVRLIRGMAYRGSTPVSAATGALLSSICVDPRTEHAGHGRTLIEDWWSDVQERGVVNAYLTTDADDNERVIRFYENAGWILLGDYVTREGRRMNCYCITAGRTVRR
jgi:ribosomal protein S18 acetylase RimI-like enzyme